VLLRNDGFRQEPVDIYFEGYDEALHGFSGVAAIHGRSPPFVDRLEIDFIPDDSSRMTSFTKGGELDYARLPSAFYDNYLSSKDPIALNAANAALYNMTAGLEPGFVYHTFNLDDPAFGYRDDPAQAARNKALRCAIIKGFDWQARNEGFYAGVARIFPGTIPPVVPEFDEQMSRDSVTHDPAAARALLAEAGWTPESLPELIYGVSSSVRQTQMFEQFRGMMQEIGYPRDKVVLKQYASFGAISEDWKKARLPLVNKAWALDFPDAENTLQLYYGPNASPGSNDANYRNPEYDRLYEQAAVMQPGPERTELYRRMNQMIVDDCVAMTGLSRTIILMWHKDVIAFPDRNIVGGFWARYVDLAE
jgi:ABC-type transport system substrate-binding protein